MAAQTGDQSGEHGFGDPRIAWNVLLDATVPAPAEDVLRARLDALVTRQRWSGAELGSALSTQAALENLAVRRVEPPVSVCRTPQGLVIRVDHAHVDGLGTLAVLEALLETPVRSSAHGVGADRSGVPLARAVAARLAEAVLHPPARVAPAAAVGPRGEGDSFAVRTIDATPRTSDLVHAAVRAVAAWNDEHDHPTRPISVAVGLSTDPDPDSIADHSAFLRLRHAERLTGAEVATALRTARLQPGGGGTATGPLAVPARMVGRLAAGRLGSTLLVSHLGTVTAPGVSSLGFHPVSGGGSGVSLGAVTLAGRTTVSLRARAAQHDHEGLEQLLETLMAMLSDLRE